jgi:hypothetical protein
LTAGGKKSYQQQKGKKKREKARSGRRELQEEGIIRGWRVFQMSVGLA